MLRADLSDNGEAVVWVRLLEKEEAVSSGQLPDVGALRARGEDGGWDEKTSDQSSVCSRPLPKHRPVAALYGAPHIQRNAINTMFV